MVAALLIAFAVPASDPATIAALVERGDHAAALAAGTAYLADHPDDVVVHLALARSIVDAGWNLRYGAARDHCNRVLAATAVSAVQRGWARYTLGRLEQASGHDDAALGYLRLALASPDAACTSAAQTQSEAVLRAALDRTVIAMRAARERGAAGQAAALARRYVAMAGCADTPACVVEPGFYHEWGLALQHGTPARPDQAIPHFETALRLDAGPATITSRLALAECHAARGDRDLAQAHYAAVVDLEPASDTAAAARRGLRRLNGDPTAAWLTHRAAHVVVHYAPDGPLASNPRPFARTLDDAHRAIRETLMVHPAERIDVWLYNDTVQLQEITGHVTTWSDPAAQAVHVVYGEPAGSGLVSCLSHHITRRPHCDSRVLTVGLQRYLDQTPASKHALARTRLSRAQLPAFEELERTFAARDDADVLAGSFVGFLLERFGRDQFLMFWRSSADGQFESAFRRHYGHDSAALSEQWKTFLKAQ